VWARSKRRVARITKCAATTNNVLHNSQKCVGVGARCGTAARGEGEWGSCPARARARLACCRTGVYYVYGALTCRMCHIIVQMCDIMVEWLAWCVSCLICVCHVSSMCVMSHLCVSCLIYVCHVSSMCVMSHLCVSCLISVCHVSSMCVMSHLCVTSWCNDLPDACHVSSMCLVQWHVWCVSFFFFSVSRILCVLDVPCITVRKPFALVHRCVFRVSCILFCDQDLHSQNTQRMLSRIFFFLVRSRISVSSVYGGLYCVVCVLNQ